MKDDNTETKVRSDLLKTLTRRLADLNDEELAEVAQDLLTADTVTFDDETGVFVLIYGH